MAMICLIDVLQNLKSICSLPFPTIQMSSSCCHHFTHPLPNPQPSWWTKKTNLTFWGVIFLTFFDLSNGFWDFQSWDCQNREFSTLKPWLGSKNVRSMTPQKWGFWCQRRFRSPKKVIGGPKKWKKLFFSKTAHPTIYLKSNMSSVNLMGTFCTGICLLHWLLIFWFTRQGV